MDIIINPQWKDPASWAPREKIGGELVPVLDSGAWLSRCRLLKEPAYREKHSIYSYIDKLGNLVLETWETDRAKIKAYIDALDFN